METARSMWRAPHHRIGKGGLETRSSPGVVRGVVEGRRHFRLGLGLAENEASGLEEPTLLAGPIHRIDANQHGRQDAARFGSPLPAHTAMPWFARFGEASVADLGLAEKFVDVDLLLVIASIWNDRHVWDVVGTPPDCIGKEGCNWIISRE
jgi:hypothetical protein